jgi:hypothetical protein
MPIEQKVIAMLDSQGKAKEGFMAALEASLGMKTEYFTDGKAIAEAIEKKPYSLILFEVHSWGNSHSSLPEEALQFVRRVKDSGTNRDTPMLAYCELLGHPYMGTYMSAIRKRGIPLFNFNDHTEQSFVDLVRKYVKA